MVILSDKLVVTRKRHVCNACGRMFEKGTKMWTQVNIYDGIQVFRSCITCSELMLKYKYKFYDDCENMFMSGCVSDCLEKDQTPEQLLELLNLKYNG